MAASLANCWDYLKCDPRKSAACSAALQRAGRKCWLVAGTLNGGKPDCDYALKIGNCKACGFYKEVKAGAV